MTVTADLKTYLKLSKQFRQSLAAFVDAVEKLKGGRKLIEGSYFPRAWVELETLRTNLLARELHAYMDFRAARENVGHTFDVEFYAEALMHKGTDVFFGVQVGESSLLWDDQNPAAFQAWKAATAGAVPPDLPGELATSQPTIQSRNGS